MKLALTVLSLLAIISASISAQTTAQVTVDSKTTTSTSFPVQIGVETNPDGTFYTTRGRAPIVIIAVGTYTVRNGVPGYELAPDSIRFSGNDETINRIPTSRVYEFLAREVVVQGSLLGFTPVASSCSAPTDVKVYSKACITREWRGVATRFIPCTTEESIWEYNVCGTNTIDGMNVARVTYNNTVVCPPTVGCDATCPLTSIPLLLQ